jgi:NAD+ kinase
MFESIAIATHPFLPDAPAEARRIAAYLESQGVTAVHRPLHDEDLQSGLAAGAFDLWIALGGDGTMLRCGQLCGPAGVPVLGIYMGRLGFLMGVQREEWTERLPRLFNGDYWFEPRMMLRAAHRREGADLGRWDVLNEAIVSRGDVVRPVQLETFLDGSELTTYHADGLIAATPTGSTAYALAAGGPILPPQLRNFLIVPIAPHLSFSSAIVLAEGSVVTIRVHTLHKAALSLDGQTTIPLNDLDEITVEASPHTVRFVRLQERDYFYRNLTSKMNANLDVETDRKK